LGTTLQLLIAFARVGTLGFGGGPAMIPLIQEEVLRHGWMTEEQFLDGLAAGYSLPGPIATKIAMYVGWEVAGLPGAIASVVGVAGPSLVLLAGLASVLAAYKDHPRVSGMLRGIRPVVLAILAAMVVGLGPRTITNWPSALIAGAALAVLLATKLHPAALIVAGGVLGALFLTP
jgi:chromate transporter